MDFVKDNVKKLYRKFLFSSMCAALATSLFQALYCGVGQAIQPLVLDITGVWIALPASEVIVAAISLAYIFGTSYGKAKNENTGEKENTL